MLVNTFAWPWCSSARFFFTPHFTLRIPHSPKLMQQPAKRRTPPRADRRRTWPVRSNNTASAARSSRFRQHRVPARLCWKFLLAPKNTSIV
jgi:hypothetical protein